MIMWTRGGEMTDFKKIKEKKKERIMVKFKVQSSLRNDRDFEKSEH